MTDVPSEVHPVKVHLSQTGVGSRKGCIEVLTLGNSSQDSATAGLQVPFIGSDTGMK